MIRVATVNLAGMRSALLTGRASKIGYGASSWFKKQQFDVVAFQEARILPSDAKYSKCLEMLGLSERDVYLLPDAHKKGHAGVALYSNPQACRIRNVQEQFEQDPDGEEYCSFLADGSRLLRLKGVRSQQF